MGIPGTRPNPRRLTEAETAAWVGLLRAHSRLTRVLDDELVECTGLTLAQYDVLVQLHRAPDHRLRMTELAGEVLLSRSGLTRLVDRLEAAGLVERQSCPSDLRGTFAALTDIGRDRFATASQVHLRGVREHVTSRLSDDEQRALGALLARLVTDD